MGPYFTNLPMESVSPKAAVDPGTGRERKKLIHYWYRCLRESMLRNPKVKKGVAVQSKGLKLGFLSSEDTRAVLKAGSSEPETANSDDTPGYARHASTSGQDSTSLEEPERDLVRVLVAPYLLTTVTQSTRSQEEDSIAPFWVPALLMLNGKLQPDPEHLPFVPRVLLDPPIGDRFEHWPTPIASWDEYDRRIRDMLVDRQEGWTARLRHAEEMFHKVADITVAEWLESLSENYWQREKPVVVPWENQPASARLILPLCEGWLEKNSLPETLMSVLSPAADHPSAIETLIVADQLHLGHCGELPINQIPKACFS